MRLRACWLIVVCPWLAACDLGVVPFVCERDEQCVDGAAFGTCEAEGYCSFADDSCQPSGRRFAKHAAPELSEQCVLSCIDSIALGSTHGCLVRSDGAVLCWGRNSHGQLGPGVAPDSVAGPTLVSGLPPVRAVALGGRHSCAITLEGQVYCWGDDRLGQTGDPGLVPHADPRVVTESGGPVSNVDQIALGAEHTCALQNGRSVWCWGNNQGGQLGVPVAMLPTTPLPQPVVGLADASYVAAGGRTSCALSAGQLWCWGSNGCGQMGVTGVSSADVPTLAVVRDLETVVLGDGHGCGAYGSGVKCWGDWEGLGCPSPTATEVAIGSLQQRAVTVVAGARHSCMLGQASATVQCWGSALCTDRSQDVVCGQLGPDSQMAYSTPTNILLPESMHVGVASGGAASCALSASGRVWCWGSHEHGQLGQGEQLKTGVAVDYVSRQVVCPR